MTTPFDFEAFANQTLSRAPALVGYAAAAALPELTGQPSIHVNSEHHFDPIGHAAASGTELQPGDAPQERVASWSDVRGVWHTRRVNVWAQVRWQGVVLDLVRLEWHDGNCMQIRHYVLGPDDDVVETYAEAVSRWSAAIDREILVFHDGWWNKSRELWEAIKAARFENLFLDGDLAENFRRDVERFFGSREVYKGHGLPWKRGILLLGPAGNGKTHAVKAISNVVDVPCLYAKSFKTKWQTDEENIRQVFERAREAAPCILVLEDLDALVNDENRSFFLNELDGFAPNDGLLTIATTNHPERLDPALLHRPSRFDRKFTFDVPTADLRRQYLQYWNERADQGARIAQAELEAITEATDGFTFAYLKELWLSAMLESMHDSDRLTIDALRTNIEVLKAEMQV